MPLAHDHALAAPARDMHRRLVDALATGISRTRAHELHGELQRCSAGLQSHVAEAHPAAAGCEQHTLVLSLLMRLSLIDLELGRALPEDAPRPQLAEHIGRLDALLTLLEAPRP